MASIQQSFNQMLISAQIGAGLYAHSPEAKEKKAIKKESQVEKSISEQLNRLREEAKGAEEITPEIEIGLKNTLSKQTALTEQQFNRDPSYLENYFSALQDEELLKTQGRLAHAGWEGLQTSAERQKTLQNQKKEKEIRRSIILNQYGKNMEVEEDGK